MKLKVSFVLSVLVLCISLHVRAEIQQHETKSSLKRSEMMQLEKKQAWDNAVATNTIEGYQKFLKENPNSIYRQEAENAIFELQGGPAWERIKDTTSIDELENFIEKYPNATARQAAVDRLHELRGLLHYNNGNLDDAYLEFYQIDRDKMAYSSRRAYDTVMEHNEFSTLGSHSSEETLFNFLKRHPQSKYAVYVSNMLAVAKARNLGSYATQYDYDQALSFAKDIETKKMVQSYISGNKKMQKNRLNAVKSELRKSNGGLINLGIEFLEFGYNFRGGEQSAWYYNAGLWLRVGNYTDRVQFAVGLTPGVICYSDYSDYYFNDYSYSYSNDYDSGTATAFHMPVLGQLKLNVCKTSATSWFFVYGQYQYNAVRAKEIESEMSWATGLGFGWKNFDWLFYYRQDIGNPSIFYDRQFYIGTTMVAYIRL